MKFTEAKKIMDDLQEEYQMILHLNKFKGGKIDVLCQILIDGHTFEGWHWQACIDQIRDHIGDYKDNLEELMG